MQGTSLTSKRYRQHVQYAKVETALSRKSNRKDIKSIERAT